MTDFNNLFACELYKTNRKRTLLKLAIALVVIILFLTLISAVLKNVLGDYINIGAEIGSSQENIESLESQIAIFEQNQTWINKLLPDNTLYGLKAQLAAYNYLNENGIAASGITYYSVGSIMEFNFYGFTEMCMSTVMTVLTIFIIVACVRATTGEYASGALKMQFISPINKNKFFTAKWLSIFVIAEAYLI
ncbi:MAG: ABC transporter permease subunit, partial [Clostridia bacterium]|nr:ABC transporter permease subunit [Clostridia bacterium]